VRTCKGLLCLLVGSAVATMAVSSAAKSIAKHRPGKTSQNRQLREDDGFCGSAIPASLGSAIAICSFVVVWVSVDILEARVS